MSNSSRQLESLLTYVGIFISLLLFKHFTVDMSVVKVSVEEEKKGSQNTMNSGMSLYPS